jgi:hypothetical protein
VFLPKVRGVETGRVITMPTHGEHILRILGEATDPLFPSGIAEVLNREPGPAGVYTSLGIAVWLKHISDQAVQVQDGRWTLKRLLRQSADLLLRRMKVEQKDVRDNPNRLSDDSGM